MTRLYSSIIFVIFLIIQPVSGANAGIVERNSFLTDMLSLAEKPRSYFLIDLAENKIILMARGISIREWKVDNIRFMGQPTPVKPFFLESKSVQLSSLRNNIDIDGPEVKEVTTDDAEAKKKADNKKNDNKETGNKKVKKFELIALELDDMPGDYQLFLNGGTIINVRSQPEGSETLLKKTGYILKWYAYYPLLTISSYYHKTRFTKIDMLFKDKTEAQALFWAFTEGTECIVLPPGNEDRDDYKL